MNYTSFSGRGGWFHIEQACWSLRSEISNAGQQRVDRASACNSHHGHDV
jgi:hypothetical protein